MKKDNKYYSLIENLVKNHRKYRGYDAILDDIIDDVYKHSKTVINTVKDDDVILSYLQKIVAVSIITVPKRMNFNTELRYRVINHETPNVIAEKNELPPLSKSFDNAAEQLFTESVEADNVQKADAELVDKMINSIDNSSIYDKREFDSSFGNDDTNLEDIQQVEEESFESLLQQNEEPYLSANNEFVTSESDSNTSFPSYSEPIDITQNALSYESEDAFSENNSEFDEEAGYSLPAEDSDDSFTIENSDIESVTEDIELSEPHNEEVFDIDHSVTESVSESIELSEPHNEEVFDIDNPDAESVPEAIELSEPSNDDVFDAYNSETEPVFEEIELSEPSSEEVFDIDNSGMESVSENIELSEQSEENVFDDNTELESVSDNIELSEQNEENSFDINNIVLEPDTAELSAVEYDEKSLLSDTEDLASVSDNIELDFNNNSDIALLDYSDDISSFSESYEGTNDLIEDAAPEETVNFSEEKVLPAFKLVDYSLFNYVPQVCNDEANIKDIEAKLIELNNQKPELNVMKIFDLKYKQNLPIAKIAEELNVDKQNVISVLDEIVELI